MHVSASGITCTQSLLKAQKLPYLSIGPEDLEQLLKTSSAAPAISSSPAAPWLTSPTEPNWAHLRQSECLLALYSCAEQSSVFFEPYNYIISVVNKSGAQGLDVIGLGMAFFTWTVLFSPQKLLCTTGYHASNYIIEDLGHSWGTPFKNYLGAVF